jgi:hypothetical protein
VTSLTSAIFLCGPVRIGHFGIAVLRRFSWRHPQAYSACEWKSVDFLCFRVYRWNA